MSNDSTDVADGRGGISGDRTTRLAWTRTILSYIRTGFASFIFGIALIRLFAGKLVDYTGVFFLFVGALFVLGGLYLFVASR